MYLEELLLWFWDFDYLKEFSDPFCETCKATEGWKEIGTNESLIFSRDLCKDSDLTTFTVGLLSKCFSFSSTISSAKNLAPNRSKAFFAYLY